MRKAENFTFSQIISFLTRLRYRLAFNQTLSPIGSRQRLGPSHSIHLQRVAGMPYFLAYIRYHGSAAVCWQILQSAYHRSYNINIESDENYNSEEMFIISLE